MRTTLMLAGTATLVAACNTAYMTSTTATEPMIATVSPAVGAITTSRGGPVSVTFRHAMGREDMGSMGTGTLAHSMEMVISVHQGAVTNPAVAGTVAWSSDRTVLTFTPAAPLVPATSYVVFLGGRMTTADGRPITEGECMAASDMMSAGGMMTGGGMMGSGMMSGGVGGRGAAVHHEMGGTQPTGMGMAGSGGMMGGVIRPDGVRGMTFTFTTAS
ncbi:MAG: Ig-like domain-containing domain [Gemmatimonadaceae bacterium]